MIIRGSVAALATAVLLAGCATTLAGTGSATHSPSESAPAPTAPTPTSAPETINRKVVEGRLGDPITADYCYGIDLHAFAKWGQVAVHPYQLLDACFIDIVVDDKHVIQAQTSTYPDIPDLAASAPKTTTLGNGLLQGAWDDDGYTCERGFDLPGLGIEIDEQQLEGKSSAAFRCAVGNVMLAQAEKRYSRLLPKRALALPTITRFDMCNLLDLGGAENIPELVGSFPQPDFAGARCELSAGNVYLSMEEAIVNNGYITNDHLVSIGGGHMVQQDSETGVCDEASFQGETTDRNSREILDLSVSTSRPITKAAICRIANAAMLDVLKVSGLK